MWENANGKNKLRKPKKSNNRLIAKDRPLNHNNQFIQDHFDKLKCIADKVRNASQYKFAIAKVLRALSIYPLPILTEKQAIEIDGIGPKFASKIKEMINEHYKKHLNPNQTKNEIQLKITKKDLKANKKKTKNIDPFENKIYLSNSELDESDTDWQPRKKVKSQSNEEQNIELQNSDSGNGNEESIYIPTVNSQAWAIILSMISFVKQFDLNFMSKLEIKQQSEKIGSKERQYIYQDIAHIKIKSWSALDKLQNKKLVQYFDMNQKYILTKKGEQIAQRLMDNHLNQLNQYHDHQVHQLNSNNNENSKNEHRIDLSQLNQEKLIAPYPIKEQNDISEGHIIEINNIQNFQVVLYVDNRELKGKDERKELIKKLQFKEGEGITVEERQLPVGDYIWAVKIQFKPIDQEEQTKPPKTEEYILDYIVERKTASDLASSIQDGRYAGQKYRLKSSKIKHIIYLIEGKAIKTTSLPQAAIDNTVVNMQVSYSCKVKKTENLNETIKWLMQMTCLVHKQQMAKLVNSEKTIQYRFTYKGFCDLNQKNYDLTIKHQFGRMLRKLPNCGMSYTNNILSKYSTPFSLFKMLQEVDSIQAQPVSSVCSNESDNSNLQLFSQSQNQNLTQLRLQKLTASNKNKNEHKGLDLPSNLAMNLLKIFTLDFHPQVERVFPKEKKVKVKKPKKKTCAKPRIAKIRSKPISKRKKYTRKIKKPFEKNEANKMIQPIIKFTKLQK